MTVSLINECHVYFLPASLAVNIDSLTSFLPSFPPMYYSRPSLSSMGHPTFDKLAERSGWQKLFTFVPYVVHLPGDDNKREPDMD